MDTDSHTLASLFDQLGLSSEEEAINHFLVSHSPLDSTVSLTNAPFWTAGQRAFLEESLSDDSDWAELVDQLDALLRD